MGRGARLAVARADPGDPGSNRFRPVGAVTLLDDAEILDVVLATAPRCFFSTVLDATGTQADAVYSSRLERVMRDIVCMSTQ